MEEKRREPVIQHHHSHRPRDPDRVNVFLNSMNEIAPDIQKFISWDCMVDEEASTPTPSPSPSPTNPSPPPAATQPTNTLSADNCWDDEVPRQLPPAQTRRAIEPPPPAAATNTSKPTIEDADNMDET
jgi:hypothetical protein